METEKPIIIWYTFFSWWIFIWFILFKLGLIIYSPFMIYVIVFLYVTLKILQHLFILKKKDYQHNIYVNKQIRSLSAMIRLSSEQFFCQITIRQTVCWKKNVWFSQTPCSRQSHLGYSDNHCIHQLFGHEAFRGRWFSEGHPKTIL